MFSESILVEPKQLFVLMDKLKDAIDEYESKQQQHMNQFYEPQTSEEPNPGEVIDAKKVAFRMKQEANEYADGILSRLQLLVTKLQKNVIKIEANITEGRKLIEQKQLSQHAKGDNYET
jgi:glycine/serine hydroxymethyltransferase